MNSTVKGILWDLDGTLVDSLPELHDGVFRLAQAHGLKEPTIQDTAAMIGRGVRTLVERFKRFTGYEGDSDALVEELVGYWAETHGEKTAFFPGVMEGIRALREKGIKMALVTNKLRHLTLDFLKAKDIEDLFDGVVCVDDCPNPKPAADMVLEACRQLGLDTSEVIMVGDSRNDALSARAANVTACLVETGYNEGVSISEWAREAGFTHVYPSGKKVCDLLLAGRLK